MNTRALRAMFVVSIFLPAMHPVAAQTKTASKDNHTIAVFSLDGPITEKPQQDEFQLLLGTELGESLKDLTARLKKAGEDEAVKAVVLLVGSPVMGTAQIEEVRSALDAIKANGKRIHAHADVLTMSQYTLLSGASEISMVPTGYLFITGLYGEQMYLRGLLEKLGVTPDYTTRGAYKSAAETFMRTGPSPEAREMYGWLFDSLYENSVQAIASGRNVDQDKARGWIDHGVFTAERAIEHGIIDAVRHRQEFETHLRETYGDKTEFDKRYGKKKKAGIDFSSPMGVMQFYAELFAPPRRARHDKDAVAVVYLEGIILSGSPAPSPFGTSGLAYSTPIRKALDKLVEDDSVKAVVFRINSGGGSAVASEVILNATRRVAAKKPFVVSMGDVAGSGGYYVACGAETIFVDASTITGSIGVLAGKFATTKMWDKAGITWQPIKRGANSGILSTYDVFSKAERAALDGYMDEVYKVFKDHVAANRGDRLKRPIDDLAGGRVFSGRQAIEHGLADQIGGLDAAIAHAAARAELDDYEIRVVPRPRNIMEQLTSGITGDSSDEDRLRLSAGARTGASLQAAALPYLEALDPSRVRAVRHALKQLEALQHEQVLLTMPILHLRDVR